MYATSTNKLVSQSYNADRNIHRPLFIFGRYSRRLSKDNSCQQRKKYIDLYSTGWIARSTYKYFDRLSENPGLYTLI